MCTAPLTLADGTQTACHECWQCRERAVHDWVGRNIAESKTAIAAHAVTLTYGRDSEGESDHVRAALLTYSDVQKFLKLLRRHGFPVRYFVTGEFGSKKGRAHWHIMLYWQEQVPPMCGFNADGKWRDHNLDRNFMWARRDKRGEPARDENGKPALFWPHGWAFVTKPDWPAIKYNCKYILKDMGDDERQGHLAMSKKPPLGTDYFRLRAEKYVENGLSPQSLEYWWPEVNRRMSNGRHEPIRFMLKDRPAELYLRHFIESWVRVHGNTHWPNSDLVDLYWEYGQVVSDENRLMAVRNPKLRPMEGPKKRTQQGKAHLLDKDDVRREIDKDLEKNGTEKQREFEQWYRAVEDQQYFYKILGKPDYIVRHEKRRAEREQEQSQLLRARPYQGGKRRYN